METPVQATPKTGRGETLLKIAGEIRRLAQNASIIQLTLHDLIPPGDEVTNIVRNLALSSWRVTQRLADETERFALLDR